MTESLAVLLAMVTWLLALKNRLRRTGYDSTQFALLMAKGWVAWNCIGFGCFVPTDQHRLGLTPDSLLDSQREKKRLETGSFGIGDFDRY